MIPFTIGNFLLNIKSHQIVQIKSIDCSVENDMQINSSSIMDFIPIEITNNVLLQLGFQQDDYGWILRKKHVTITYINSDFHRFNITTQQHDMNVGIRYVHELQNVLNVCELQKLSQLIQL